MIRLLTALVVLAFLGAPIEARDTPDPEHDPLLALRLPDAWQDRFWASPGVGALLDFEPGALAALVPTQAGLRFCRCPSCGASELDDTLSWSPAKPGVVSCKRCGVAVPNDTLPAKIPPAPGQPPSIPDEIIEVRPRVFQHYSYHLVEPEKQAYPEERLYLAAKRDYEARAFLAKAALYAAIRHRDQPPESRDPRLARLASILLLRFAQVYGIYALHDDRPHEPKILHTAELKPPFRAGYRTSRWDWLACHEVPIPLLVAFSILRDDPALSEAGTALGEPEPRQRIEESLIRPSATLLALQPADDTESTLYAARGLLAAAHTLGDPELATIGLRRLERVLVRGFRHDGTWPATTEAERARVAELLTAWHLPLIEAVAPLVPRTEEPLVDELRSRIALARSAAPTPIAESEVLRTALSAASRPGEVDARLLGGAGQVRLHAGPPHATLRVSLGPPSDSPQAPPLDLRVEVAGRRILGESSTTSSGTVAHPLFFAADERIQVAALAARDVGPEGDATVRQLVVTVNSPEASYAVSVLEAGPTESTARATLAEGFRVRPRLAPDQSPVEPVRLQGPAQLDVLDHQDLGVRLHLLDSAPIQVATRNRSGSPDRDLSLSRLASAATLEPPPFVLLIEPSLPGQPLGPLRVGRLTAPTSLVALAIETTTDREYLLINRNPGTVASVILPDGDVIKTDGLVTLVRPGDLTLAGGTFAERSNQRVEHPAYRGAVRAARILALDGALGSFEVRGSVGPADGLVGRTLLIRHGDGVSRAWTIARVDILGPQWARYWVQEDPAFVLDSSSGIARDHVFPQADHPGPHTFGVSLLTRRSFPSPEL